ncbi:MAG: cupin domain-containing protein [Promethearchaeia archaeon]
MYWKNIISEINTAEKPIVKKDLLKTDKFYVALVHLGETQKIPPHPEDYAVFFYILEGKGTFATKEGKSILQKGDSIYYKNNELRGIESHGNLFLLGIQEPH